MGWTLTSSQQAWRSHWIFIGIWRFRVRERRKFSDLWFLKETNFSRNLWPFWIYYFYVSHKWTGTLDLDEFQARIVLFHWRVHLWGWIYQCEQFHESPNTFDAISGVCRDDHGWFGEARGCWWDWKRCVGKFGGNCSKNAGWTGSTSNWKIGSGLSQLHVSGKKRITNFGIDLSFLFL